MGSGELELPLCGEGHHDLRASHRAHLMHAKAPLWTLLQSCSAPTRQVPPDVPVNFAQKGPDGRTNANTKKESSRDKNVLKLMHWQNYQLRAKQV